MFLRAGNAFPGKSSSSIPLVVFCRLKAESSYIAVLLGFARSGAGQWLND
jgi:hypothetical protein